MPDLPDVLIVGAGVVGAAIFHELAVRGARVTIVDANRAGSGGTAWSGGVVRCYHDDPVLADRATTGWRYYQRFGEHTGFPVLFTESGYLHLVHPGRVEHARAEVARLSAVAPLHWLDADTLAHRFGHLLHDAAAGAVWEPCSGYLEPAAVTAAFIRAGQDAGGRLVEGVRVDGLLRDKGRVVGAAGRSGPLPSGSVVLAAGARTPHLLDATGIQHDLWSQIIQVDLRIPARPVTGHPAYTDDVHDLNGRPDPASGGIYLGHPTGLRIPAHRRADPLDPEHTRAAAEHGARRFNWVGASTPAGGLRAAECFTAARHARVGPVPGHPGLLLATGFNGGGFKMAPWAATTIADLLGTTTSSTNGRER